MNWSSSMHKRNIKVFPTNVNFDIIGCALLKISDHHTAVGKGVHFNNFIYYEVIVPCERNKGYSKEIL